MSDREALRLRDERVAEEASAALSALPPSARPQRERPTYSSDEVCCQMYRGWHAATCSGLVD